MAKSQDKEGFVTKEKSAFFIFSVIAEIVIFVILLPPRKIYGFYKKSLAFTARPNMGNEGVKKTFGAYDPILPKTAIALSFQFDIVYHERRFLSRIFCEKYY